MILGEWIGVGIIGPIRARHPLMEYWKQEASLVLNNNLAKLKTKGAPYPIGWSQILMEILNKKMKDMLAKNATKYYSVNGENYFAWLRHMYNDLFTVIYPITLR